MRYEEFIRKRLMPLLKANQLVEVELYSLDPAELLEVVQAIPEKCGLSILVLSGSSKLLRANFSTLLEAGAKATAAALEKCLSLQTFELNYNDMPDEWVIALAPAIEKCTSLLNLSLSSNRIGDKGATALATAIAKCTSLQTLDLSSNDIGDEGAMALATAIAKCTSLQTLNLSSNVIGDEGATSLANAVKYNLNMKNFDLGLNRISDRTIRRLQEAEDQKQARLAVITLLRDSLQARDSGQSLITQNHITRFVKADGDHAIMTKVLRLLI